MGKLHTLRRAIERDPESWIIRDFYNKRVCLVKGTDRYVGNRRFVSSYWTNSYRGFVIHVLNEMGYNIVGGRPRR